jgi:hypothetical protein
MTNLPMKPKIDESSKLGKENRDLLGKVITIKNIVKHIKPQETQEE